MRQYGQFCPIAKSAEIVGDPWAILIVREMLLGSSRFSVLQRGMPRISPTVLNKRLKELEERGVIATRPLKGQRGYEYRLTPAGRELSAVVEALAVWGMRWARDEMSSNDQDVSFLMFDIQRRIDLAMLPDGETVLCFQFQDVKNKKFRTWWLVCSDGEADLCYVDPGKDVDCYVSGSLKSMIDIWMGDLRLSEALREGYLHVTGERLLCQTFSRWFTLSAMAKTPRPTAVERQPRASAR